MPSFSAHLSRLFCLNEEDYVYTTDQSKTIDHVKEYIKDSIKKEEIDLGKNSISVKGDLIDKFVKLITINVDNDQIAATKDLTDEIEAIVVKLLSNMLDQNLTKFETTNTTGNNTKNGDNIVYSLNLKQEFESDDYRGACETIINARAEQNDGESVSPKEPNIIITSKWYKK